MSPQCGQPNGHRQGGSGERLRAWCKRLAVASRKWLVSEQGSVTLVRAVTTVCIAVGAYAFLAGQMNVPRDECTIAFTWIMVHILIHDAIHKGGPTPLG